MPAALPACEALEPLCCKRLRVMIEMIAQNAGDEVVTVVVLCVHAQCERMPGGAARCLQQMGPKLRRQELVRIALIHEQGQALGCRAYELERIPRFPGVPILAQIGREGLLSPWNLHGRNNRRERRDAAISAGIAQRSHQRAVPSHGMPEDASLLIRREMLLDE